MPRLKLRIFCQDFAAHFLHVNRSVQPALAVAIHSAIWNWIEGYPTDFIILHQKGKRLDGGAETLFDIVHSMATTGDGPSKAKAFWPTQAALLLLCPDILDKAIHREGGSNVTKKASQSFAQTVAALKLMRNYDYRRAFSRPSGNRVRRRIWMSQLCYAMSTFVKLVPLSPSATTDMLYMSMFVISDRNFK